MVAISERIWLETTSRVRISCVDGPRKNGTRTNKAIAAAAMGAAIRTHDQDNHPAGDSALAAWRTGAEYASQDPAGALK